MWNIGERIGRTLARTDGILMALAVIVLFASGALMCSGRSAESERETWPDLPPEPGVSDMIERTVEDMERSSTQPADE